MAWNSQVLAEVAAGSSIRRGGRAGATLQCQQRWDGTDSGRPHLLPHTLVIAEEECFVLENWAADGTAKLVLETSRVTGSLAHGKRVTRQVGVAFTIVEESSVEGIGARFGLHRLHRGDSLPELSVKILGGDLGFRHGLVVWIDDNDAENGILIVRAVQGIVHAAERLAINLNLLGTLWVLVGRVGPTKLHRTRQQQLQIGKVMVRDGQCFEVLRRVGDRHISPVRLELRHRISVDGDHFAGGANRKYNIDFGGAVGIHLDAGLLIFLKTRLIDRYGVRVRNQVLDPELATLVGGCRDRSSLGGVSDYNRRIRYQRTGGVGDCSVDGSVNR